MQFSMRFDFRNPSFADTSTADRYAAALDMAEWADEHGCTNIGTCEHHGSADGYIPSPIVIISAMAPRTTTVRFMIAALLAPFHDPLRLAEDLCVLDNVTKGRLDLVVAAGYAREEFEMFDRSMKDRPKQVVEVIQTLRGAFSGQPFEYRGRTVHVTPPPYRPGGPTVIMGGSSEGAARRAARLDAFFVPSMAHIWEFYRDELVKLGKPDPGPAPFPEKQTLIFLATDVETAWKKHAPFFLHDTNAYGQWQAQDNTDSPYRTFADAEALRAAGMYRILTPEELIAELKATEGEPSIGLHPMCGGVPPELAWESLRLLEREVLPAFS
jgi:alkanesulfonate monooxygenase SsuD/methylene tetrahydromethanopterin reductase-like flavin-dependent oxidoreductase (luciferase family)